MDEVGEQVALRAYHSKRKFDAEFPKKGKGFQQRWIAQCIGTVLLMFPIVKPTREQKEEALAQKPGFKIHHEQLEALKGARDEASITVDAINEFSEEEEKRRPTGTSSFVVLRSAYKYHMNVFWIGKHRH